MCVDYSATPSFVGISRNDRHETRQHDKVNFRKNHLFECPLNGNVNKIVFIINSLYNFNNNMLVYLLLICMRCSQLLIPFQQSTRFAVTRRAYNKDS